MGVIAAAFGGMVVALLSGFLAGFVAHPFESFPWIFATAVGPSAIAAVILRVAVDRAPEWSRRIWLMALCVSYLVGTIAGALGAPAVESLRFGVSNVNLIGYLQWGPLYGAGLLPITFPIAAVLARIMWTDSARARAQVESCSGEV
jgi:hypothetical protein